MKKRKIFHNKYILWGVVSITLFIVVSTAFIIGIKVIDIDNNSSNDIKQIEDKKKAEDTKKALKELQKLVDEDINKKSNLKDEENSSFNLKKITDELQFLKQNGIKIEDKNLSKKANFTSLNSESIDYAQNSNQSSIVSVSSNRPIIHTHKPKLVIIMDDMSFRIQVKKLKNLHLKITPSFFPPTYNHPYTAEYAKEFKHYMVHFPMQATNPNFHEEPKTLHIDSSSKFIEERVKFIKKNFPTLKFINNHTGSKFTSNLKCMEKLYKVLDKYNIIFIDSVTTPRSKAPIVAKEDNKILLQRDVFLDNIENVNYIRKQLKRAVRVAKKRGYAIAICHPHDATFKALKSSKDILKDVELIYIGEMYEFAKEHHIQRL